MSDPDGRTPRGGAGGGGGGEADDGLHEIEEEEPPRGEARRKALAAALQQVFAQGADSEQAWQPGERMLRHEKIRGVAEFGRSRRLRKQAQC